MSDQEGDDALNRLVQQASAKVEAGTDLSREDVVALISDMKRRGQLPELDSPLTLEEFREDLDLTYDELVELAWWFHVKLFNMRRGIEEGS